MSAEDHDVRSVASAMGSCGINGTIGAKLLIDKEYFGFHWKGRIASPAIEA
jgi:hypothetical protein